MTFTRAEILRAGGNAVDAVVAVIQQNVALARRVVTRLAERLPHATAALPYPRSLEHAIITDRARIPPETRARLDRIVGHHLR